MLLPGNSCKKVPHKHKTLHRQSYLPQLLGEKHFLLHNDLGQPLPIDTLPLCSMYGIFTLYTFKFPYIRRIRARYTIQLLPSDLLITQIEVTQPLKRSRIKHPSSGHWEEPGWKQKPFQLIQGAVPNQPFVPNLFEPFGEADCVGQEVVGVPLVDAAKWLGGLATSNQQRNGSKHSNSWAPSSYQVGRVETIVRN